MTLLLGAYDETRRATRYLRWHEDVDSITPSLYAGKTRRSTRELPAATPPAPPAIPPAPSSSAPPQSLHVLTQPTA